TADYPRTYKHDPFHASLRLKPVGPFWSGALWARRCIGSPRQVDDAVLARFNAHAHMQVLPRGIVEPHAVGHRANGTRLAVLDIPEPYLRGLLDVVHHPLVIAIRLGVDLEPHD